MVILEQLLHLHDGNLASGVCVDVPEDLPQVVEVHLLLVVRLLDLQVHEMLGAGHGALHEHARDDVEDAEEGHRDVDHEQSCEGPVRVTQRRHDVGPVDAAGQARVEEVERLGEVAPVGGELAHVPVGGEGGPRSAVVIAELRDVGITKFLVVGQELRRGLSKGCRKAVDDDKQQEQRPEQGVHRVLEGVRHLAELVCVGGGAHKAQRP
mmetsp:Transcript_101614/g.303181  ORF Transcript_101614/g.303181 Transcript_101614/m.303181 type:complete len:209 (-) Transcript_101614:890-1516(-)